MKAATVKKHPVSLADLQEAFEVLYAEFCTEFSKIRTHAHQFQRACPSTEAYDQAWADLYVSLSVLETKARSLQELLDQINQQLDNEGV